MHYIPDGNESVSLNEYGNTIGVPRAYSRDSLSGEPDDQHQHATNVIAYDRSPRLIPGQFDSGISVDEEDDPYMPPSNRRRTTGLSVMSPDAVSAETNI